jgi:hypothetical protein
MAHVIYFAKGDPSVFPAYKSALANVGDFDLVLVRARPDGLSSAYGRLATEVCDPETGVMCPGLCKRFGAPRAPYETTTLVTFSAGYKLAERMLAVPGDADALDAYVAIDSIHADFDPDHTASDLQVAPFVDFAKRAKAVEKVFWLGHSDVPTPQVGKGAYASTTQVADEIVRLAGGEGGYFHRRAYDVERNPLKEHLSAIQRWGPAFLAEAMKVLLSSRAQRPA